MSHGMMSELRWTRVDTRSGVQSPRYGLVERQAASVRRAAAARRSALSARAERHGMQRRGRCVSPVQPAADARPRPAWCRTICRFMDLARGPPAVHAARPWTTRGRSRTRRSRRAPDNARPRSRRRCSRRRDGGGCCPRGAGGGAALESLPRLPPAAVPRVDWPPDERPPRSSPCALVAQQPERFAGRSLRQALAAEGFAARALRDFPQADDEQRRRCSVPRVSPGRGHLRRPRPWIRSTTAGYRCSRYLPVTEAAAAGLRRANRHRAQTSTSACAGSCRTSRRSPLTSRAHRAAARAPECRGGFVTDKPAARAAELRAQIAQNTTTATTCSMSRRFPTPSTNG